MPLVYEKSPLTDKTPNEIDVGLDFYYQTANLRKVSVDVFANVAEKNASANWREHLEHHHKKYQFAEKTLLTPDLNKIKNISFVDVVQSRESVRLFSGEAMSFIDLSNLLQLAYGVRPGSTFRTAPSGGACYPIEIYVTVLNVAGLTPGLYHFNPVELCLARIREGDLTEELLSLYENEAPSIESCAAFVTLTGLYERTVTHKYKSRGWRLLFLDAGHLGQNLWLSAHACGVACVAAAGGWDYEIPDYLKVQRSDELYLLSYILGVPCKR